MVSVFSDLGYQPPFQTLLELAAAFPLAAREPPKTPKPTSEIAPYETLQAQLKRAEVHFRTLVESIPAVTFLTSLDDPLNELYVSPQIEALLGYSQQEWLEDPILWYNRLHPDDRERWHQQFARTCAAGERFLATGIADPDSG